MIQTQSQTQMDEFMNNHLFINHTLKKELGEVMTPPALIAQMNDTFPPSVWNNPHLTWLEPTCGSGHFMICVYFRLMAGLTTYFPDETARREHIIRNMLFMVDINLVNVETCRSVFGPMANVECMDILKYTRPADIIIGNVPFQTTSLAGGKNKLYEKITAHCLGLLKMGGWMCLIVPDNLFCGGSTTYRQLVQHRIHTLNVCKSNQQYFPKIQQYVCYFLLEKEIATTKINTRIVCNSGEMMNLPLLDRPINPIRDWNMATETLIQTHLSNTRNKAVYVRGRPIAEYIGDKYKVIYTPNKWLYSNNEFIEGLGIKKVVIFSISIQFEFSVDWDGTCGVGPNTFYIPIETREEGLKWVSLLNSAEYKILASACRTCRQFVKNAFVNHLICQ